MKNYSEMSDNEINEAVASALGVDFEVHESGVYASVKWCGDNVVSVAGIVDYCNNWADAGPVIFENSIALSADTIQSQLPKGRYRLKESGTWTAEMRAADANGIHKCWRRAKDKNPLRAAMIVFLMIKDNETRILAPDEVSNE